MRNITPTLAAGSAAILVAMAFGAHALIAADREQTAQEAAQLDVPAEPVKPELDKAEYDRLLRRLAHVEETPVVPVEQPVGENGEVTPAPEPKPPLWPVSAAYPNHGAILPFKRIVAYYGNFYSKGMGVLGEYPEEVMLDMLRKEMAAWEAADPETPVQPAIEYIAITAQLAPGKDGMYRARMPHNQIEKALTIAEKVDAIVIVDVQAGLSDVMTEVRSLEPYLKHPNVHLAIDPEFAMRPSGARPGTRVGTVDARDVNAAAEYLAALVREHDLPPKILVVHRYTRAMVTNATKIVPLPEVQIVMDMDGWGPPAQKYATYNAYIAPEPVQFTGFKLFYKNDRRRAGSRLLTPQEILDLTPSPSFIQYQ